MMMMISQFPENFLYDWKTFLQMLAIPYHKNAVRFLCIQFQKSGFNYMWLKGSIPDWFNYKIFKFYKKNKI